MKYTVACLGIGNRGKIHLRSLLAHPDRFDVVALCDIRPGALAEGREISGLGESACCADAERMLSEVRPDVFCFITLPDVRVEMVRLVVKYKVKGLIMEKPMAQSLTEAREIARLCRENGIKCVVSHQQKYLESMQALKAVVDSGELGRIERVHVETRAWFSQLGTHFIDYALWAAGSRARWAVGHAGGREKLTDHHPSPDFLYGLSELENGARLYFECGYLSEKHLPPGHFWTDNRLTVYGERGYVYAETDGAFGLQLGDRLYKKQFRTWGESEGTDLQHPFAAEFADWLDGKIGSHSCNVDISLHGFEILQAMCLSSLEGRRVDLPLAEAEFYDVIEIMKERLPEQKTYSAK
jgi:predicted dehydrogenase